MSKTRLLFRGPALTASGYGVHSRQLVKALLACGVFDVSIQAVPWGNTAITTESDPFLEIVRNLSVKHEVERQQGVKYDVSVQCTIPNEFDRKLAHVNIGVTAGIECDHVSPDWLLKTNSEVDLLVVPSKHSKDVFDRSVFHGSDGSFLKLEKKVEVVPEGVDVRYYNTSPVDSAKALERFSFSTKWNFLAVGLGLDRGFGEDRKNISSLVKWFCETFKDDREVGLVLKLSIVNGSLMDFEAAKSRITDIKKLAGVGEFPKIHLVHGRLSDEEMGMLYKHPTVKALVSPTHGEGFGLPILEAAACGLPVIATEWSGHLDFLSVEGKRKFVPLEYSLDDIPASAVWKGVMEQGTKWANVSEQDFKSKLKKVRLSYEKPKQWAEDLAAHVAEAYSLERVCYSFAKTVCDFLNEFSTRQSPAAAANELKTKFSSLAGGKKTLIYTMPMSAGDVFLSTGVVSSLRKKFPDHAIFFAVDQKYAQILEGNADIDHIVPWEQWMIDVPLLERTFTEVFTPNLAIQTVHSNWVRGGKGRRLADEIAAQCNVESGPCVVRMDPVDGLPEKYVVVHPGSGKGQHEARNYLYWQEVIENVSRLSGLPVVQVGTQDEPLYDGVVDIRGKTTYNQLATVIDGAKLLISIDSVAMHMAAELGTHHVSIFGSSYSTSTGPARPKGLSILLDTPSRYTCDKACYKYQCSVDKDHPCINEIAPATVTEMALQITSGQRLADGDIILKRDYREHRPKISGYTHVLNPEAQGYPYLESIRSMLGFCDEVVVVDGGSTDGSTEKIKALGDKVNLVVREWDWGEPGMDGMQKAFARATCSGDFLWQQDADEVVSERDYEKIVKLVKRFPKDVDLMHLPVVELWGDDKHVRTDRHSWKWRLSRNNFRITHGINKAARVFDEKTGKTFARKGMSDGCEYIDIMTGEHLPHKGFYNAELEMLRQTSPQEYGAKMNAIFSELPSVYHYSWADLPRKVRNFRDFWDKCWSNLYNDAEPKPRFPDVKTDEDVERKAAELREQGGEHGRAQLFELKVDPPALMKR